MRSSLCSTPPVCLESDCAALPAKALGGVLSACAAAHGYSSTATGEEAQTGNAIWLPQGCTLSSAEYGPDVNHTSDGTILSAWAKYIKV